MPISIRPLSFLVLACASSFVSAAQSFSNNVDLTYQHLNASNESSDATELMYRYYFTPVNTDNVPINAAAFLGKNSSIAVIGGYYSYDYGKLIEAFDYEAKADSSIFGAEINYITPENPIIINLSYSTFDIDYGSSDWVYEDIDVKADHIGFGFGYYLTDNLAATLSYDKTSADYDWGLLSDIGLLEDTTLYDNTVTADLQYVGQAENGYYFSVNPAWIHTTGDGEEALNYLQLAGEFYFNRKISTGLSVIQNINDNKYSEATVSLEAYLTESAAMRISYNNVNGEDDDADENTWSLDVTFNF